MQRASCNLRIMEKIVALDTEGNVAQLLKHLAKCFSPLGESLFSSNRPRKGHSNRKTFDERHLNHKFPQIA